MPEPYGPDGDAIPAWEAPPGASSARNPSWASPGTSATEPKSTAVSSTVRPTSAPAPSTVPTFRSWQPGFLPLRPLGLGDFLSYPMKAMQFNRAAVVGGPLLCILLALVTGVIASILVIQDEPHIADWFTYTNTFAFEKLRAETVVAIIIALLSFLATDVAARAFVIPGVSKGILGQKITVGEAWAIARPRLPQLVALYVLGFVLFIGSYIGVIFLAVALGSSGGVFFAVLLVIGYFVMLVLAFVVFTVAVNVVVLERLSAAASIGRATKLTRGSTWRLLGCSIVIGLVLGVIQSIFNQVGSAAALAGGSGVGNTQALMVGLIIYGVVYAVMTSVLQYSFMGTATTLMYVDLRIRREGFDVDIARAAEAAAAGR